MDKPPGDVRGDGRQNRLSAVVGGLLLRLRLDHWIRHHDSRRVMAAFAFLNGGLSIGLLGMIAHIASAAFIFPSLGPTAFLLFHRPLAAVSSPRNTILGHLIGALAGWLALAVFGLLDAPPVISGDVGWQRVGAAALSLGTTSGLMILFRVPHPPAGATTLIVSLGFMPYLWQMPVLMAAVVLMVAQAMFINRLAGVPYPLWQARPGAE